MTIRTCLMKILCTNKDGFLLTYYITMRTCLMRILGNNIQGYNLLYQLLVTRYISEWEKHTSCYIGI